MPKRKPTPPSKSLKDAIRKSGLTWKELAELSEVDAAAISRFMASERSLTLPAVDKLCAVLNLSLL